MTDPAQPALEWCGDTERHAAHPMTMGGAPTVGECNGWPVTDPAQPALAAALEAVDDYGPERVVPWPSAAMHADALLTALRHEGWDVAALDPERERLRAALESIAQDDDRDPWAVSIRRREIAREALKGTKP